MCRIYLPITFFLFLLLVLSQVSSAVGALRVNEAEIRVSFFDKHTEVWLPIENATNKTFAAKITVEFLNTDNLSRGTASVVQTIKQGANKIIVLVELRNDWMSPSESNEIFWYRLSYRIEPEGGVKSAINTAEGIISLSEVTPDFFHLRVVTSSRARAGNVHRLVARTVHPLNSRPVEGVKIEAEIEFYHKENNLLKATTITDADGYARIDFNLPANLKGEDEFELKVTARLGAFVQEAEKEVRLDNRVMIWVNSDKPLYQPGQTLHLRALAFDASRRALPDTTLNLEIKDPEGSVVFEEELKTSRFGIASVDWPIPPTTRLGEFFARFELDGDGGDYDETNGSLSFKISRYELPNFAVEVRTNQTYYASEQKEAEITVRAEYLFGKPVARGRVRVVQESKRKWDYDEQRWDTDEGEAKEGDTNSEGVFITRFNLEDAHKDFLDENGARFKDLHFAAYFTDPTTNRTESRRFDIRITREPIHIYFIGDIYKHNSRLPLFFYLAAYYADGAPASNCTINIKQMIEAENEKSDPAVIPLGQVRTNALGIAKVSDLKVRKKAKEESDGENKDETSEDIKLAFDARDSKGNKGTFAEDVYLSDGRAIRVQTAKTLLKNGEAIEAEILSTEKSGTVFIDLLKGNKAISSQKVVLNQGRAKVTFPFGAEFAGRLTIVSHLDNISIDSYYDKALAGWHSVLYPQDDELKINSRFDRKEYRPGDEARVEFQTIGAEGRAAETALGVVVFDKAVEERARTDKDFGGGKNSYGFYDSLRQLFDDGTSMSGYSPRTLNHLDMTKPLPEGLDLLAEVLLQSSSYDLVRFDSKEMETDAQSVFNSFFGKQFKPFMESLDAKYKETGVYPSNEETLRRLLMPSRIILDQVVDPWGTPYRYEFSVEHASEVLSVVCAGPDKMFKTNDDFTVKTISRPYFRFIGEAINRAIESLYARTGGFIRDETTLKSELMREGVDFDKLRDPNGKPYCVSFGVIQRSFIVEIKNGGPTSCAAANENEPFVIPIWSRAIRYFTEKKVLIENALAREFQETKHFPQNEKELREVLKQRGVDFDAMRDPWGENYYAMFKRESRPSGGVNIYSYSRYGDAKATTKAVPISQEINVITIRSKGWDKQENTRDDFDMATFSRVVAENDSLSANQSQPFIRTESGATTNWPAGTIKGTVVDIMDAIILGAKVVAKNSATNKEYSAETNEEGVYFLRNLPSGLYEVRFSSHGFKSTVVTQVPARAYTITKLDVTLEVGAVNSTVEVTSNPMFLETSSSQISSVVKRDFQSSQINQASTPRLREYFPETLVWQPQIETDKQGHARIRFKLADNITTWKMSVVGSTVDGQIGVAEKEFPAFQPFFLEHEPPRILTEGDEISLPVVIRNYTDKAQPFDVEMKPESWFSLIGPRRQNAQVSSNDSVNSIFTFRAVSSIEDGKQRVTAKGSEAGDAIEKPVTVHPDGQELFVTSCDIFNEQATLESNLPPYTLTGSQRSVLKLYPNLMAHVVESVEGILKRPYGCGEQTTSSTYPSILLLKAEKNGNKVSSSMLSKAREYAPEGYKRLLTYRVKDGSFTYWGSGDGDIALTAYVLRFLKDASEVIAVDEDVLSGASAWLIKKQNADGSWTTSRSADKKRTAFLTAYIARVLAKEKSNANTDALKRAIAFLRPQIDAIEEPYLAASYALIAFEIEDEAEASRAIEMLQKFALTHGSLTYWDLQEETPFHGWGVSGQIETTALALQALAQHSAKHAAVNSLISRGLLFLFKQKDAYGVWHSTQATINVLDAFLALKQREESAPRSQEKPSVEIFAAGKRVSFLAFPSPDVLAQPLAVDLSSFINAGNNRIEIKASGNRFPITAQLVTSFYIPWSESKSSSSKPLRLTVVYDKTETTVGDEINCAVEAERTGYGYGMLLAEIGLPPGADVDRASLERAMKETGGGLNRYDILPDRVVAYLSSNGGNVKFSFKFKPRYGIKALTASSQAYDYYNPEARVVLAPTKFVVK